MSIEKLIQSLQKEISPEDTQAQLQEVGEVMSVGDGIVSIYGLYEVGLNEIVRFESGKIGLVMEMNHESVEVVLFDRGYDVHEGEKVFRTKNVMKVPTGKSLLGRVVNALGQPIDGGSEIDGGTMTSIYGDVPGITARQSVFEPMKTGTLVIDALIPVGRGQRELIIGDRKTGKTTIALDAIINQKRINDTVPDRDKLYCVYVAIGQKQSAVAQVVNTLSDHGAMEYVTIVSATAADPAALNYIAPFVGCTMAEYFRDRGMHALIIYDDLSKHAVSYRQLSLLLRRPPGREAYPGDIFYLHSRLLERASKLNDKLQGGSLTALPIIETQAGDISAYIPTNVISITDGQIFLDTDLFYTGNRPAVSTGLSVSRVGSAAQTAAMRSMVKNLKLELSQYRELLSFAQFGSELDKETVRAIEKGKRIMEGFKQSVGKPLSELQQILILFMFNEGLMKKVKVDLVKPCVKHMLSLFGTSDALGKLMEKFMSNLKDEGIRSDLSKYLEGNMDNFLKTHEKSRTHGGKARDGKAQGKGTHRGASADGGKARDSE